MVRVRPRQQPGFYQLPFYQLLVMLACRTWPPAPRQEHGVSRRGQREGRGVAKMTVCKLSDAPGALSDGTVGSDQTDRPTAVGRKDRQNGHPTPPPVTTRCARLF